MTLRTILIATLVSVPMIGSATADEAISALSRAGPRHLGRASRDRAGDHAAARPGGPDHGPRRHRDRDAEPLMRVGRSEPARRDTSSRRIPERAATHRDAAVTRAAARTLRHGSAWSQPR